MTSLTDPRPAGAPCWFELTVADPAGARDFYTTVLGWRFGEDGDEDTETAYLRDRAAAAIRAGRPDGTPSWTVYLAVRDVEQTIRAVEAAGGAVVAPPHATPAGTSAIVAEPTGGHVGLYRGGTRPGIGVIDEPGAFCWTEASSRKPAVAAEFFGTVFGLEVHQPFPRYQFRQLRLAGVEVAGVLGYTHERRPNRGRAAWLVYFQVADTDDRVRVAVDSGGRVVEEAETTAFGRLAILADPFGARFAVITRPAGDGGR